MTGISGETAITIGGLLAVGQLVQIGLALRKASRDDAPRPPNQDLDKSITRLDSAVSEHTRRITAIEESRAACRQWHLSELDKQYKKLNATAELLAETVGEIKGWMKASGRQS